MRQSAALRLEPMPAMPMREPIPFPNAAPKVKWSHRLLDALLMLAIAGSVAAIVAMLLVL